MLCVCASCDPILQRQHTRMQADPSRLLVVVGPRLIPEPNPIHHPTRMHTAGRLSPIPLQIGIRMADGGGSGRDPPTPAAASGNDGDDDDTELMTLLAQSLDPHPGQDSHQAARDLSGVLAARLTVRVVGVVGVAVGVLGMGGG